MIQDLTFLSFVVLGRHPPAPLSHSAAQLRDSSKSAELHALWPFVRFSVRRRY